MNDLDLHRALEITRDLKGKLMEPIEFGSLLSKNLQLHAHLDSFDCRPEHPVDKARFRRRQSILNRQVVIHTTCYPNRS